VSEGQEFEYGEGKSRQQEADDSVRMLGTALLASVLIMGVVVLVVWAVW